MHPLWCTMGSTMSFNNETRNAGQISLPVPESCLQASWGSLCYSCQWFGYIRIPGEVATQGSNQPPALLTVAQLVPKYPLSYSLVKQVNSCLSFGRWTTLWQYMLCRIGAKCEHFRGEGSCPNICPKWAVHLEGGCSEYALPSKQSPSHDMLCCHSRAMTTGRLEGPIACHALHCQPALEPLGGIWPQKRHFQPVQTGCLNEPGPGWTSWRPKTGTSGCWVSIGWPKWTLCTALALKQRFSTRVFWDPFRGDT